MEKGFNLPITHNVPVEIAEEFEEEIVRDAKYITLKQNKINKSYNSKNITNLRKVGEYLLKETFITPEISIEKMSKDLDIPEGSVRQLIILLNSWDTFPLTMIPVPKKAGYIQSVLKNQVDYENWDLRKERTIATMEQIRSKAKIVSKAKAKSKKNKIAVTMKVKD